MLFADKRNHSLKIPSTDKDGRPSTIGHLIDYLCQNVMKDTRKELFVLDDHLYVPAVLSSLAHSPSLSLCGRGTTGYSGLHQYSRERLKYRAAAARSHHASIHSSRRG